MDFCTVFAVFFLCFFFVQHHNKNDSMRHYVDALFAKSNESSWKENVVDWTIQIVHISIMNSLSKFKFEVWNVRFRNIKGWKSLFCKIVSIIFQKLTNHSVKTKARFTHHTGRWNYARITIVNSDDYQPINLYFMSHKHSPSSLYSFVAFEWSLAKLAAVMTFYRADHGHLFCMDRIVHNSNCKRHQLG